MGRGGHYKLLEPTSLEGSLGPVMFVDEWHTDLPKRGSVANAIPPHLLSAAAQLLLASGTSRSCCCG